MNPDSTFISAVSQKYMSNLIYEANMPVELRNN